MNPKFNVPIRYGIIAALVMIIISFLSYLFYRQLFGSFGMQIGVGLFFLAIAIFIPVWGGVTFRRDIGGIISFKDAFIGVFIICALSSAGSCLMQYLIPNVIDKQYAEEITQYLRNTTSAYMEKMGAPDEKIDETMKQFTVEKFQPDLATTGKSFLKYLGFNAILSLIIAAFIRRNSGANPVPMEDSSASA